MDGITWADYAIVAAFPLFIWGWGWEGWDRDTQTFIKNPVLFTLVNITGAILLLSGVLNQTYSSPDGGIDWLRQILVAFWRVLGLDPLCTLRADGLYQCGGF